MMCKNGGEDLNKIKRILMLSLFVLLAFFSLSPVHAEEIELDRSKYEGNGMKISEIITKEFVSMTDDTSTYTLRYYLEHSGDDYAYQNVPVGLYVDNVHIATFQSKLDVHVANGKQLNGQQTITITNGVEHKVELKDLKGGSISTVNVSTKIYHPLPTYSVKYLDWNGSVLKDQTVTKYQSASAPGNPSRTGYTFTGWSGDSPSNVTSNRTIRANYNINYFTVRHLDHNGTVLKTQSVPYGSNASAPGNPSRTGYTFTGWSNNGASITANRDIKAQYNINYYTVRYLDHNNTVLKTQSVPYGSNASAPSNPSRTGHTFAGWSNNGASITGNRDIKAQYNINYYMVRYLDYNGTVLKTQSIPYSSNATPPATPSRVGHTFIGWNNNGLSITGARDIYAQYKINTYIISFHSNGGSGVSSQSITYGSKASNPSTPTRSGYGFVGWYSDSTLNNSYNFNSPVANAMTLYAKWDKFPTVSATSKAFYQGQYTTDAWMDTVRWQGLVANDAEDGNITSNIKIISDNTLINTPGTYTVKYSITDSYGSTVTTSSTIVVKFNNPPQLNLVDKRYYYQDEITLDEWQTDLVNKDVSASDIEDGDLTAKIQIMQDNVDPTLPGEYKVLYRITDKYGKTTDKISTVIIKLNNAPIIIAENKQFTEGQYTKDEWIDELRMEDIKATDIEDGTITSSIVIVRDNVDPTTPGYYQTIYKVTDRFGKSVEKEIETEIVYNNPPSISVGNKSFYEDEFTNDEWIDDVRMENLSATDDEDGNLTDEIVITKDNVDPSTSGNYEVVYSITDQLGKTTIKTIDVNVVANQAPHLQIVAENRRFIEGQYSLIDWINTLRMEDVEAFDFESKNLTDRIEIIEDKVDPNVPGIYEVTYKVTDDYGKSVSKKIKVTVEANQAPILLVTNRWFYTSDDVTTKALLAKVMAYDDQDGTITNKVELVSTTVKNGVEGDYEAIYQVSDKLGKSTTAVAHIHIVDRGGLPVDPTPPPVNDPDAIKMWNGKQGAEVSINKLLEDSDVAIDAYKGVVFGIYSAEDITYGGKIVLPSDSLVDVVRIDAEGQGSGKITHAGRYYVKELSTDNQYNLDSTLYHFDYRYQ